MSTGKHRREEGGSWHRSSAVRVVIALASAFALALGTGTMSASASVSANGYYYNPGDTVHISGDGMAAGESVTVAVFLPSGSLGQKHVVSASSAGTFADSYTLPSNAPDGIYQVVALGKLSGHVYRTSFDPGTTPDCLQFLTGGPTPHFQPVTPTAVGGDGTITVSWTDQCTNEYGYYIQRYDGTSWTTIATIYNSAKSTNTPSYTTANPQGDTVSYTDTLDTGDCNAYLYRVEAFDLNGQQPTSTSNPSTSASSTATACTPQEGGAQTPTLTTTPLDASDGGSPFALAAQVHDNITLSATNGTPTGSVSIALYQGSNCTDQTGTHLTTYGDTETVTSSDAGTVDSTATASLHAGDYYYLVTYTSDTPGSWNDITTPDCEAFTVDKADVLISTSPYSDAGDTAGTPFNLGDSVHDSATITGIETTGFEPVGTVNFTFYGDNSRGNTSVGDCSDTPSAAGSASVNASSPVDPVTADSDTSVGPLHAGSYGFDATYTDSSGDYNDYAASDPTTDCEPIVVNTAATSTTTQLVDASGSVGAYVTQGDIVWDTSTTTSTNISFAIGGTTTFKFWTNGTCSNTATHTDANELVTAGAANETDHHTLSTLGSYCWNATYNGDGDYAASATSANEPLTVVPPSQVTNSSLCTFDTDTSTSGRQFNLIYTPDVGAPTYKLNASNPGQFYYNAFYVGAGNTTVTLNIPGAFVSQGAVPLHVYSGVTESTVGGQLCFTPGTDITSTTSLVAGYSSVFTSPSTSDHVVKVTLPSPLAGGFAYINIHLDYGYKGVDTCTKSPSTNTANGGVNDATGCKWPSTGNSTPTIVDQTAYKFTSSTDTTGSTIKSENIFKKDPGIGGDVTRSGNPVVNTPVNIYDGSNHLLATVYTDSDGWYIWAYKYSGKAATFVVKTNGSTQTVTLKSNGYLVVNFLV